MAPGTNSHCLVTSHAFRYVHKGPGYFWNGCIVSQTWSARDVGPNITGEGLWWENGGYSSAAVKGCFYVSEESNHLGAGESDWDNAMILMDASRSSSIYGRSDTVHPSSLKLLPCIKA